MTGKINAVAIVEAKSAEHKAIMAIVTRDGSKSAKIRELANMGVGRSTIAALLTTHYGKEVKYQHVRNVLETKLASDKK